MSTGLIIAIAVIVVGLLAAGAYYLYQRQRRAAQLGVFTPLYATGGENYMITLGIGTPAEIAAFLLLGLTIGDSAVDDTYITMRRAKMPFPPGFFVL